MKNKMNNLKSRIFVSCSSNKIKLLKTFNNYNNENFKSITVYPGDMNKKVNSSSLSNFINMPRIHQNNKKEILNILKYYEINYVLPTSDYELLFWSKNKLYFQKQNITIFISDNKTIKFCQDKLNFMKFFKKNELKYIPTSLKKFSNNDNFIVKNRYSYDNKFYKTKKIKLIKNNTKFIFQKYIYGKEYSLDCWFNEDSELKNSVLRERLKIKKGLAIKTVKVRKPKNLLKIIKLISNTYKFYGAVNFQFIINDKNIFFLECNPRVSGRIDASIKFGLKIWNYAF